MDDKQTKSAMPADESKYAFDIPRTDAPSKRSEREAEAQGRSRRRFPQGGERSRRAEPRPKGRGGANGRAGTS